MEFILGRTSDKYNVITDKNDLTIHRKHLECSFDGTSLRIKDLSTNGTFVNHNRMKKGSEKTVSSTDLLELGPNKIKVKLDELLRKLRLNADKNKTDFRKEFAELIPVFEEFEKKKRKIHESDMKQGLFIRLGSTLFILILLFFIPEETMSQTVRLMLMVSIGLIGSTLSFFSTSKNKKKIDLDVLQDDYEDVLICPKCKAALWQKSLAVYRKRKSCKNKKCDAQYF